MFVKQKPHFLLVVDPQGRGQSTLPTDPPLWLLRKTLQNLVGDRFVPGIQRDGEKIAPIAARFSETGNLRQ